MRPLAGAQIAYYGSGGSWQPTQATGSDGAVHLNLNAGSYTFQATWNGGSQQQTLAVDATHTTLTFRTLDVRVPVRDSDGDGIAGAVLNFYGSTGSWIGNRKTDDSGVLRYELLPGTYRFQATYNGGSQQQSLAVDEQSRRLIFRTQDVTVALLDSDGDGVAGGVQNFYGSTGSWVGNRTIGESGVLHYELLPGSYTFQTTHSGGSQQLPLVVEALTADLRQVGKAERQKARREAREQDAAARAKLREERRRARAERAEKRKAEKADDGAGRTGGTRQPGPSARSTSTCRCSTRRPAGIAGAVVNFYGSTGSWVGNRTTGSSGLQQYELLPGTYHFQATYNGGSQQQVAGGRRRPRPSSRSRRSTPRSRCSTRRARASPGPSSTTTARRAAGSATARRLRPARCTTSCWPAPIASRRRTTAARSSSASRSRPGRTS